MTAPVRYVRSIGALSVEIAGEHVMLGPRMNEYFGFRDVAAFIWEQLAQPRTLDDLCAAVVSEYAVDDATCRHDTEVFLDELLEQRLGQVEGEYRLSDGHMQTT
ncbi:MAG: hypothetical protein JWR90_690 [Marmoricola sp.]|nr:hypothetical protein [Marmoricola sp.]